MSHECISYRVALVLFLLAVLVAMWAVWDYATQDAIDALYP